jgi:3-deoxy-D-manno-octulosonic-acid transferase
LRRAPAALQIYRGLATLASPLARPWLAARARDGKEDRQRLGERLGRPSEQRPHGPLVWLHGASVGESLAILPLAQRFRELRPDLAVLLTTGTRTAAGLVAERLPLGAVHQYIPLDTPRAAKRFIDFWRPNLAVFVESELWPILIGTARRSGARMALVSARLSEGSARRWSLAPASARWLFAALDCILARDSAQAERLHRLGARIDGIWDAKRGAAPLPGDPIALAVLEASLGGRPMVLAASTHLGEEGPILAAFAKVAPPESLLVLAPRHPARANEIADLARAAGLSLARRSRSEDVGEARVYLADTLGELGLFYRLALATVIGGSLVPGNGGHNPLEAARLGCPFAAGPYVQQWPIYIEFAAGRGCLRLDQANALAAFFAAGLAGELAPMGRRAAKLAARLDAETMAVAPRLLQLLDR